MTEYKLTPSVTFPSPTISQDVAARKAARKQVLEKAWQTRRENYLQFLRKKRQLQASDDLATIA